MILVQCDRGILASKASRGGWVSKNMSLPSFLCNLIVPSHFSSYVQNILILCIRLSFPPSSSIILSGSFRKKVSQDQWPESSNFAREETYRKRIMREGFPRDLLGLSRQWSAKEELAAHNKTYLPLHTSKNIPFYHVAPKN